jgi:hypothetical protein
MRILVRCQHPSCGAQLACPTDRLTASQEEPRPDRNPLFVDLQIPPLPPVMVQSNLSAHYPPSPATELTISVRIDLQPNAESNDGGDSDARTFTRTRWTVLSRFLVSRHASQ